MPLVRKVHKVWSKDELRKALKLYAVTDSQWLGDRTLESCVADAVVGGVTFVQLREKGASTMDLVKAARNIAPVCRIANIPFVINDDVEAAKTAGVDGVHIGQDDAACEHARKELGSDAIIGVSVQTVEEAKSAERAGADYLGVGAICATDTKPEAGTVSIEQLREICDAVSIPVVAIGGVNVNTIPSLKDTGIAGIAVVSAIFAAKDIETATAELDVEITKVLGE